MDSQVLIQVPKVGDESGSTLDDSVIMDMNITVQSKHIHPIASLLIKNKSFHGKFVQFMHSLNLPSPYTFQLEAECGNTSPPFYNVLSKVLSSWMAHKGRPGATFHVLLQVLEELNMTEAVRVVQDYVTTKGNSDLEMRDIPELSRLLSDDETMNKDFLKFLDALGLPNTYKFNFEREFEGVGKAKPVVVSYNLVSKALTAWRAWNGGDVVTFKALVENLKKNGLGTSADDLTTYLRGNVVENDAIDS